MTQSELKDYLYFLHNDIGVTYSAMAKKCGVDISYLRQWILTDIKFSEAYFKKVCDIYGTKELIQNDK